jgi:hypothetical protein
MFANTRIRIMLAAVAAAQSLRAALPIRREGFETSKRWRHTLVPRTKPGSPKRHVNYLSRVRGSHVTTRFKPNGAQECARRVRQTQSGMLTESNGLLLPGYVYLGRSKWGPIPE